MLSALVGIKSCDGYKCTWTMVLAATVRRETATRYHLVSYQTRPNETSCVYFPLQVSKPRFPVPLPPPPYVVSPNGYGECSISSNRGWNMPKNTQIWTYVHELTIRGKFCERRPYASTQQVRKRHFSAMGAFKSKVPNKTTASFQSLMRIRSQI